MSIMDKIKKGMGVKSVIVDPELDKLRNDREYENAYNEVAQSRDMRKRFEDSDKDISVGNMYQRKKKKSTKPKTKRCRCKK